MNINISECVKENRATKRNNVAYEACGWKLQVCDEAPAMKTGKTFIFVVEDVYLNYFIEYIQNLNLFDAILTFPRRNAEPNSENSFDFVTQTECVFVIAQNLMVSIDFWALQPNCCLLITEQLTEERFLKQAKEFINKGGVVVTYSKHNQFLLDNKSCYCLLYQYSQTEVDTLRSYVDGSDQKYDVAMVPCRFERREIVRNELKKAGLTVLEIDDKWGVERDRGIASCRILLNVHVRRDYTVYEHLRCDRWLFAGKPTIVSENCINESELDCGDLIYFANYNDIVSTCVNIVQRKEISRQNMQRIKTIGEERRVYNQSQVQRLLQFFDKSIIVPPPSESNYIAQYGTNSFKVDVTNIVKNQLCKNSWLSIDATENFNHLFGDVAKNIPKALYLREGVILPESRKKTFEGDYFTKIDSLQKIPIFIISHNRLSMLLRCVEAIRKCFDVNSYEIVVHDNVSTYQPLIDYLQNCGLLVYWNKRNELDDVAISVQRYFEETKSSSQYYAVTDPDVEFQQGITPADTMSFYAKLLDTHPSINAVGPELRVDDIPDHYPLKYDLLATHTVSHANDRFVDVSWRGKVVKCAYRKLDTTFGLYRRSFTFHRLNDAILCHDQYCARHLDWYIDPNNMEADDLLYMQKTTRWGHWSSEYLRPLIKNK